MSKILPHTQPLKKIFVVVVNRFKVFFFGHFHHQRMAVINAAKEWISTVAPANNTSA
jgi:hypothetical protein